LGVSARALVVDPAVAPLFHGATAPAAELGITLPEVVMMPAAGLLELVSTRQWSRAVNPILLA
jgi:type IV secretory pathway VirB3-like protein